MEALVLKSLGYLLIWKPLGYFLAFLSMIAEGEVLLLLFAFFTNQGYFDIRYMFFVLISGALVGDIFWYYLGYSISHSDLNFPEWIHRLAHPLDRHLLERPARIIFVSKFAYGTNHATLMRAGALQVGLKSFIKLNLFANAIWVLVVGGLGYVFGASLAVLRKYIRFAEIVVLVILISFIVVSQIIFRRYEEKISE